MGADGWSFADVLPHFRAIEDYDKGESKYRGACGGLHVRTGFDPNALSEPFLNAAVELGFDGPYGDYNAADNTNVVGPLQFSITADGRRASAVEGFLKPARSRANLTILTEARVTRVLFEGSRAVGVEYLKDGQTQTARASHETIISAGAFMSPKLLMLSGIGPADHLKANNIAVQVDSPGVGQNLQDHLQLPVVYNATRELPPTKTLCGNILFAKTRSGMEMESPDLQMIFSPTVPIPLAAFLQFPNPVSIFIPILVRPFSRGEVRLRSSDPMAMPIVNPNYLSCDADVQTLKSGVELVRRLAATRSFAPVNAGEMAPGEGGDVEGYVRTQCTTIWHPAGTCKMGRDALSVVDPQLRVYGVEGLRVADASIMPTVTAGNTNAPSAMIGHRLSDFLLAA
jgi:choline dehydrogenase